MTPATDAELLELRERLLAWVEGEKQRGHAKDDVAGSLVALVAEWWVQDGMEPIAFGFTCRAVAERIREAMRK